VKNEKSFAAAAYMCAERPLLDFGPSRRDPAGVMRLVLNERDARAPIADCGIGAFFCPVPGFEVRRLLDFGPSRLDPGGVRSALNEREARVLFFAIRGGVDGSFCAGLEPASSSTSSRPVSLILLLQKVRPPAVTAAPMTTPTASPTTPTIMSLELAPRRTPSLSSSFLFSFALFSLLSPPAVGLEVGSAVGWKVGWKVGSAVGLEVGSTVGSEVGSAVGLKVGSGVGSEVGSAVGLKVGSAVGSGVG
jgi:hypothetical protein